MTAVGGGAFENRLAREGGASQMGLVPLWRRPHRGPAAPPPGDVTEKESCLNQETLPDTKSAKSCEK